jgi:hypothetical protein
MSAKKSGGFENLFLLEGLWRMDKPNGALFEEWKKINNELLQGRSFILKENDTIVLEQIRLAKEGDEVFYIPSVKDQNSGQPVTFTMLSSKKNQFTFENKSHDFPQRIIYRFVNNDSVVARIEGVVKGKEKWSEFYYTRVK